MIAALVAPLGGLTQVIRYLALLGIPSAAIFGTFIDETRGLSLEVAAKEDAWASANNHERVELQENPAQSGP